MKRLFIFSNDRTREKLSRHFRKAALLCGVFLLLVTFAWKTLGQGKPKPPGLFLDIQEVFVTDPFDLVSTGDGGSIDIVGENLNFGSGPLVVLLGTVGALSSCVFAAGTPQMITCDLPDLSAGASGSGPGDYLVTVSRGMGQSENDEYDLTISEPPIPDGTIAFFNGVCPPGWSEEAAITGRVIVGVGGGTLAGTVGTALTDLEDRTHTHDVDPGPVDSSVDGDHNHSISDAGDHTHDVDIADFTSAGSTAPITADTAIEGTSETVADDPHTHQVDPANTTSTSAGTHNHGGTTGNAGDHDHSVDVGNTTSTTAATSNVIPYIQLRACSKDPI